MEPPQAVRPFELYSNLVLGRAVGQGIYIHVTKPAMITVYHSGYQPGHMDTMRLMLLSPRHVRILRSELFDATPMAAEMLKEVELRAAYSAKKRAEKQN